MARSSINPISNLPENDIRKLRICHLHFNENAYIFSLNRRRLKHDAIPTKNLPTRRIENISQPSTSQVQETNAFEINVQYHEDTENISQPTTSQDIVLEKNIDNTLEKNSQQVVQHINLEILNTPKKSNNKKHFRSLLGNITRKNQLTPIARQLYAKSSIIQKQNNNFCRNLLHYKRRLKYATKFSNLTFFKKYSTLSYTQKMFIEMQINNCNKKSKVNFSIFCTKIKSALKKICNDEHASIFLENIGINS